MPLNPLLSRNIVPARQMHKNQLGNLTMGVAIAILVASILTLSIATSSINSFKTVTGTAVGNQLQAVTTALNAYIVTNQAALLAGTNIAGVSVSTAPTVSELQNLGFLSKAANPIPSLGGNYVTSVDSVHTPMVGGVYLTQPFLTSSTGSIIDLRILGAAKEASPVNQIGFSLPATPLLISGNGWSFTNPLGNKAGILYATTALVASAAPNNVNESHWLTPVATLSNLPVSGNVMGDVRLALDTGKPYRWGISSATGSVSNWIELFTVLTQNNTTLQSSISMGLNSGFGTGYSNVFMGETAGGANLTGYSNAFIGSATGTHNTTGFENTFVGAGAGGFNTAGQHNVFLGTAAGSNNAVGIDNVYLGHQAGYSSTGSRNTLIGKSAGVYLTTAQENTVVGYGAGAGTAAAPLTGQGNSIFGAGAGAVNTSGQYNVYLGRIAGNRRSSGDYNITIGSNAATNSDVGSNNIFIGNSAGNSNTQNTSNTASQNVLVGTNSGSVLSTGVNNSFYGVSSGLSNTSGNGNTFIGAGAGSDNTTGSNNVAIGINASVGAGNSKSIAIGANTSVTTSNTVRIGNTSVTSIGGQVSFNGVSDVRLKRDIHTSTRGLSFIRQLRPVDYVLKSNNLAQTGFIAQEVETIDPHFEGIERPSNSQDFYRLTYTSFIPSIVKSIQELDEQLRLIAENSPDTKKVNHLLWAVVGLLCLLLVLSYLIFILERRLCALKLNMSAPTGASEC